MNDVPVMEQEQGTRNSRSKETIVRLVILNSVLVFLLFYLVVGFAGETGFIFNFKSSPEHVLLARTLFRIPKETHEIENMPLSETHYAQFQFYPVIIRLVTALCFNNAWFAIPVLVLLQTCFFSYSFLFMLMKFKCTANPLFACYVAAFYPVGMTLLRHVALPHTLSISCVCMAFGYFRKNKMKLACLFAFFASVISYEGFLCPLAMLVLSISRFKILDIFKIMMAISGAVSMIMALNYFMYGDCMAFVYELSKHFSPIPFSSVYLVAQKRPIACIFGTILAFLVPGVIGTMKLLTVSGVHFIYCGFALALLAFMNIENFENFGCGLALFAGIIGCNYYINYVIEAVDNVYILLVAECIIVSAAARGLRFHSVSSAYVEYVFSDSLVSDI